MNEDELILKPKRPKGEDGYKVFSVRVKEELVGRMDEIAAETGRSRNELINVFLEFAIHRCKVEK